MVMQSADFASVAVLAKLDASEHRLNVTESQLTEKFDHMVRMGEPKSWSASLFSLQVRRLDCF
eukprot:SAG11_NODE_1206_length_5528_cov_20.313502_8_plen_63_part_00